MVFEDALCRPEAGDTDNNGRRPEAGDTDNNGRRPEAGDTDYNGRRPEAGEGDSPRACHDAAAGGDLAARLRRKLLLRMEKMVDEFPGGAVTETKSQQDDVTRMFKLRDLTAAYKDLAGGPSAAVSPAEDDVEDLSPIAALAGEDAWAR